MSSQFLIMCCRRVTNFSRESVETESWTGQEMCVEGRRDVESQLHIDTGLGESVQLALFPGQLPRNKAKCMFAVKLR